VPRRPAENERPEDDGDGSQSLAGTVLALAAHRRRRLGFPRSRRTAAVARPGSTPSAAGGLRRPPAGPAPRRRPGLPASAPVTTWGGRRRCRRARVQLSSRLDWLRHLLLNAPGGVRNND